MYTHAYTYKVHIYLFSYMKHTFLSDTSSLPNLYTLFLRERGKSREKKRERNINRREERHGFLLRRAPTGYWTCNQARALMGNWNWRRLALQDDAQRAEPLLPGLHQLNYFRERVKYFSLPLPYILNIYSFPKEIQILKFKVFVM